MHVTAPKPSLDLSKWRKVPLYLIAGGGLLSLIGLIAKPAEFAHSWLLSFMFYLSIGLGGMFLVLAHHLFDAGWSVPIRRVCEHISTLLFPTLAILFIPIALMAKTLYPWMHVDPAADHALHAKLPLFTVPGFYVVSGLCFLLWWFFSSRLLYWSLKQDETGDALPTYRMRFYSALGVFVFAVSLTMGVVMWMKSMQWQWFSTMYGVYYFAGSAWLTIATVYVITMVLDRLGVLDDVLHDHQYYYLGSLMFAFTVFYAYIHFSQYFIIWNANMPEETFWYVAREKGTWFWVGMVIIFGHFFLPFLALLRIDVKSIFPFMVPLCLWAWLMHFVDLSFNILPVRHEAGFPLRWLWLYFGTWAFMGGVMALVFVRKFTSQAPYPIKDPRLSEAMGLYHPVSAQVSGGEAETESLSEPPPQFGGINR